MDREFFAGSDVCFVQSDGLNKPVKRHGKQSRKWRLVREIMITDPAFIAGTPDVFVYGGRTVFQEGQDWKRSGYGVGCAPDINVK